MNIFIDHSHVIEQFRDAMRQRSIIPPDDLIADGSLRRANVESGRSGKDDAAYLLHLDGNPAGGFENHKDGLGWQKWRYQGRKQSTPAERRKFTEEMRANAERRANQKRVAQDQAAARALTIWENAAPCETFAYLDRKHVASYGLRICQTDLLIHGVQCKGALIVPAFDAGGKIQTLQFIPADPSADKRFLPSASKSGASFLIGRIDDNGKLLVVVIAEGYATGATVHAATGYPVIVAFDAGNLLEVARMMRDRYPDAVICFAADDDRFKERNTGKEKAMEASHAVGGVVALPNWHEQDTRGTDFNDAAEWLSMDDIKATIDAAISQPQEVIEAGGRDAAQPTTYQYGGGTFEVRKDGVHYCEDGRGDMFICSPLRVIASTRDGKSSDWGALLEWHDRDGIRHQWSMPMELLQGDGNDVRRELVRQGMQISTDRRARDLLSAYLQLPVDHRARCVDRMGWDAGVYVTPSESIGQEGEIVVFQNVHALEPALSISGTREEWRQTVGAYAFGNSRLMFALSAAFAPPLLDVLGEDSGAVHLKGSSSCGKTTILKAAASVWGSPNEYIRLWRATANGLEGMAALHNDGLLILDELSQIEPKDAGEAAYMLANGQGKVRSSRTGTARAPTKWRLLVLSAGEESLSAIMAKAGKKANAGQEIRLADLDADSGCGMGAFGNLHTCESPETFATVLKDASSRYYGAVGVEWLHIIVKLRTNLAKILKDGIADFIAENVPNGAQGQVTRVARRFALIAMAGELATQSGLTGWGKGDAIDAAATCFRSWLDNYGGAGNREERALFEQVRGFIEAHGESRFEDFYGESNRTVYNRAGFVRVKEGGDRQYMVLSDPFKKEICAGFDTKWAAKVLIAAGWIEPEGGGRSTQKPRIPAAGGSPRVHVITNRIWEDGHAN